MERRKIIQVDEKVPVSMLIPLSVQHMFAMFGASILVPTLFGIDPAIVLLMNGIGTILFIIITKGKAPAYLGSSFAFLGAGSLVIANFGYQYALGGFVVTGACGCLLAFVIYKFGTNWIDVVLPLIPPQLLCFWSPSGSLCSALYCLKNSCPLFQS